MKKVFIQAYLEGNLGDDLFVELLLKRYPDTKFFTIAPKYYKKTFKNYDNITIYYKFYFLLKVIGYLLHRVKITNIFLQKKQKNIIKNSDIIIKIGGSIFQENEPSHLIYKYDKFLLEQKKPIYCIGCNFGSYKTKEFYQKYYDLFSNFEDICFRDSYSYNLFEKLDNARCHSDIIFSYPFAEKKQKKQIGISVMNLKYPEYEESLNKIIKYYLELGYEIALFSFSKFENDCKMMKKIFNDFNKNKKIKMYNYDTNIEKFLNVFQESEIIIATRFHSLILALSTKKPVFTFVYSDKTKNVLNDLDLHESYIEVKNIKNFSLEKVIKNINEMNLINEAKNAELHFEKLDLVLKEKNNE